MTLARSLSLVAVFASLLGCRSKGKACDEAVDRLDPITKELDAIQAMEPRTPTIGSAEDALKFGQVASRLEAVSAKVKTVKTDDAGLAKHLAAYDAAVTAWAAAARRAQEACAASSSKAMLDAMSEETHQSSRVSFVIADLNSYCHAP